MSTLEEISRIEDGSQKQVLCEKFIRRAIEEEDLSLCREYVDYGGFEISSSCLSVLSVKVLVGFITIVNRLFSFLLCGLFS